MAEGYIRSIAPEIEVVSAGTRPAAQVHPKAIQVMKEAGIDLSAHRPKLVDGFLGQSFDYVITVCDHAKETCPLFTGTVRHRLHFGFADPADATGTEDEILQAFRNVRDEIAAVFAQFLKELPHEPQH